MSNRFLLAGLALCAGCWTVRETQIAPETFLRLPEGRTVRVQIAGFEATVTTYEAAYGYATVYSAGYPWYGRYGRPYGGFGATTVTTTSYIPHTSPTAAYRDLAADELERAGCVLQAPEPQYRLEVRFEGPFPRVGDTWAAVGWPLCTLLTADYGAQEWCALMKIHDVISGKLVYSQDYVQRCEAVVWGPIPLFSPSSCNENSEPVLKGRCLSALTCRAVADALRFFAK